MWQAHYVTNRLREIAGGHTIELVPVSTIGDRDRTEPLANMGGMGVFTREVQRVVLDGHADLAVHSLKDLPTETIEGLALAGIPERAPRCDALILPMTDDLDCLPQNARIGTGSLRRQAQLLSARPDLEVLNIRGNVETRLKKLNDGEYDAIILAEAGLRRLNLDENIHSILGPPLMLPAVGQASLGIECRSDDTLVIELLSKISDKTTRAEVLAERACLRTLRAGCHAPVGTLTTVDGQSLSLEAVVLTPDGLQRFQVQEVGDVDDPETLGARVAEQLIEQGASAILHSED
ncbi:UNVERIFIED_CONTAM: hypothetical protein GTU68_021329 [Idotea baltica]|nr:hypothetical protein [Idotea baltica]